MLTCALCKQDLKTLNTLVLVCLRSIDKLTIIVRLTVSSFSLSLSLSLSLSPSLPPFIHLSSLRRKQPKYPVLFLTTNLLPKYGIPFDVREQSIYDAMMHAKTEKLLVSTFLSLS